VEEEMSHASVQLASLAAFAVTKKGMAGHFLSKSLTRSHPYGNLSNIANEVIIIVSLLVDTARKVQRWPEQPQNVIHHKHILRRHLRLV
jgi:hypothetical protein